MSSIVPVNARTVEALINRDTSDCCFKIWEDKTSYWLQRVQHEEVKIKSL
jgi:hypothetical protein